MKRLILILCVAVVYASGSLFGQAVNDTIRYSREKGDLKYFQAGKEIKFLELSKILKSNSEANEYIKKAKLYRNLNGICVGMGVISLAYGVLFGLGQAIENNEESDAFAGFIAGTVVGGVFIALSIPSGRSYKINARKAIDIYNRDIKEITNNSVNLKTGISQNGISIILTF